jgi:putative methionine-R-sulfoxide reductase with GAF domain
VIPLRDSGGNVTGVLDIDSENLDNFDEVDKTCLEKIALLF